MTAPLGNITGFTCAVCPFTCKDLAQLWTHFEWHLAQDFQPVQRSEAKEESYESGLHDSPDR